MNRVSNMIAARTKLKHAATYVLNAHKQSKDESHENNQELISAFLSIHKALQHLDRLIPPPETKISMAEFERIYAKVGKKMGWE